MSYVGKITDTSGNTGLVGSTLYGTCSTGASTAAKVVTCADFDKLIIGVTIHVKFSYSNTAANPTLNVNSTGAKNIYYAAGTSGGIVPGTTAATSWYQGAVVSFTYDGTSWYMNDHITGISADAGSATNPVYFSEGQPKACTYSLNKTVPSGAVFTDTNDAVTQTATTTDANYEVLFSGTADDTTRTEGVRKDSGFLYNPSLDALTVGGRRSNSTTGNWSSAVGYALTASGNYSHAEGNNTTASGSGSHTEGAYSTASGGWSHAEGTSTTASGSGSHAEGTGTTANHKSQHVFGEYNIADPSTAAAGNRGNYVEIVGNGVTSSAKSNARTLDWDGNEVLAGQLTDKYGLQSTRALTQAQYNALSTAEKNNGTCYYITDAESVEDTLLWSKVGTGTIGTGDTNLTSAVNTLNDRTKGIKQVVAGTKVVATTAKNYQQIFSNAEINSLLGVTGSSNGNIVVLVENGDYSAQPKYLGSVVYENGNYFVKPIDNSTFTTGNMRVNYVVIRFA